MGQPTLKNNQLLGDSEFSSWRGDLRLGYRWHHDRTEVIQAYAKAPLRIQRPFYPESPQVCHSVMLHTAGGMVGGDRLNVQLDLQAQAQVLLTTAAASKVYRAPIHPVSQTIELNIAPQACLEWLPQDTIIFNQARYHQSMRVNLAPGGLWLAWEMTRFGRTAREEIFTAGNWQSHTEVWQDGLPLWIDRQWLPGTSETFYGLHGLNGCPVVGSLVFIGQEVSSTVIQEARVLWPGPLTDIGVSRLAAGMICRYRGQDRGAAQAWFIAVWGLLRVLFLGRVVCVPRVWGV
ncbi:urease accessory protein UreD [Thermosynechococcaceae cyanobacterium BACA0444]|uniref:Urease accessory protein UreD n=1 Tax=Pseudocalidococcus azoricus BACA0444 TaxID=2918990 RepID=A0AAE4FTC3_9CYAN|nr:urease accessory protein UreD [Pseudocalidococcus azoricus]MDS3861503.1 urease accessory protein UreD [Pseudocalidococcus azoricus BACA0444]